MMMNAYNKTYLDDAMHNLGVMLDYGTLAEGDPSRFFSRFIVSGIAEQFGKGNPKYIVGMSGIELAENVFRHTGSTGGSHPYSPEGRSSYYWAGWALAYLQWHTGLSFEKILNSGMDVDRLLSMYRTYHEADITKFLEAALSIMAESAKPSPLKHQRRLVGMTQQELSERSGVKLRMIQAYEQNYQDISKAEAATVIRLARALSCDVEDLIWTTSDNFL